ncbi:MAG: U32 family peptidase [Alphaproteobacteria bacterium]|nr:U32 family peptidase [Alphaproteobacteria bacterium]
MRTIELLCPAKDKATAIAAIDFGADAVYMGAPKFGARAAAGNTIEDIAEVSAHAHKFNAKVYITLNTILYDDELAQAKKLAQELANAGADAFIVQDMAFFEMAANDSDFPNVPLFASTQCDSRDAAKVKWLEQIGASRVILARELSLGEIADIKKQTKVDLESFAHGALCVSYSGQCYLSEYCARRSANRGECAQLCRMKYSVVDSEGKALIDNKFALSLKDFRAIDKLEGLADAGITSFKIEGRLKDISYVKNLAAAYRTAIGKFARHASSGKIEYDFAPDPAKSFNRQFSEYFLNAKREPIHNFATPKSMGEFVGSVKKSGKVFFEYEGAPLHSQDGICFEVEGELKGFLINKVDDGKVFARDLQGLRPGMKIYRNFDAEFERQLEKSKTRRRLAVNIAINDKEIVATDADGNKIIVPLPAADPAKDADKAFENIKTQFAKTTNTDFYIAEFKTDFKHIPFFPLSTLNALRNETFAALMTHRIENYKREPAKKISPAPYPDKTLDATANVANRLAKKFYESCGAKVEKTPLPFLMHTKYCIKHALGICKKPVELQLKDQRGTLFPLSFDCKRCEMKILPPVRK